MQQPPCYSRTFATAKEIHERCQMRRAARLLTETPGGDVFNPKSLSFPFRLLLEQPSGGNVDSGARVFDHEHAEAGFVQVAGCVEAADVRRDAANGDGCDCLGSVECDQSRMLRSHGIGFEIALE